MAPASQMMTAHIAMGRAGRTASGNTLYQWTISNSKKPPPLGGFEELADMATHDIAHKLRGYTRHPTMGGSVSVPQSLLSDAINEIERLRSCVDPRTRCDRCDGTGRLMYGDQCPDCSAAGHRARMSANQQNQTQG